jgi:hypothetical protein
MSNAIYAHKIFILVFNNNLKKANMKFFVVSFRASV